MRLHFLKQALSKQRSRRFSARIIHILLWAKKALCFLIVSLYFLITEMFVVTSEVLFLLLVLKSISLIISTSEPCRSANSECVSVKEKVIAPFFLHYFLN